MAMHRAANARVLVNNTFYAVQRFMIGARTPPINVSNTEGKTGNPAAAVARGYSACLPDIYEGRIRLVNATFDDAENPFAAPLILRVGVYVAIIFRPTGSVGVQHNYGNCLVVDTSHDGAIPGPQPVTVELQTDGFFVEAIP